MSRGLSSIARRRGRSILAVLALLALVCALALAVAAPIAPHPTGTHAGAHLADGPTPSGQCPANLFSC